MTSKRKNFTEEKKSTRDLIVEIAEQEIAVHGVEALRLKDVADKVGIQLPSLYAHFAGRKELLEALANELLDTLIVLYTELAALPPREALLASADRTIDLYQKKRGYARLLLYDFPAPKDNCILAQIPTKIDKILDLLDETIKRGVAEKTVRDLSPEFFLSFRLGLTLLPLFMRLDRGGGGMVSDPEEIGRIKREANHLLAHFIAPR
ncbi:TetR/AcrR family transcriptional regulator [uncultured Cohaesibacter sp.]|uniref:TetR/AcrR family transcriptional regulator n=1 Tax=uncultured Cohaesibacter sp. TaxID=1002546 RepID=UPI00293023EF|nr:TetR/AcrR family transcriptional regulator [uncultured Cohaesibacter sp.]